MWTALRRRDLLPVMGSALTPGATCFTVLLLAKQSCALRRQQERFRFLLSLWRIDPNFLLLYEAQRHLGCAGDVDPRHRVTGHRIRLLRARIARAPQGGNAEAA